MLRARLNPHPDGPRGPVSGIEAELSRHGPRRIGLRFVATGDFRDVVLPPTHSRPRRVDGLWRHSCFEAFVRAGGQQAYYEFNLAPSGDWACYRFAGYRQGMRAVRNVGEPRIETRRRGAPPTEAERAFDEAVGRDALERFPAPFFMLTATLELKRAVDLPIECPWRIGLSAIVEARDGALSYWALAHPPGKPDFHHDDCFALELPPANPS